jgi:hypothetical protein
MCSGVSPEVSQLKWGLCQKKKDISLNTLQIYRCIELLIGYPSLYFPRLVFQAFRKTPIVLVSLFLHLIDPDGSRIVTLQP